MTITERRDLAKYIDADFETLRGEMNVFANELKRNRLHEIEEQFREREEEARGAQVAWREVRRQCIELVEAFRTEWQERGFSVTSPRDRYGDQGRMITMPDAVTVTVPEKNQALTEVENDVNHQLQKARQELERQRLGLQKDLLLTGIMSEEAQGLLSKMPNPREMLTSAITASGNRSRLAIEAAVVQDVQGPQQGEAPAQQVVDNRVHIPEVLDR